MVIFIHVYLSGYNEKQSLYFLENRLEHWIDFMSLTAKDFTLFSLFSFYSTKYVTIKRFFQLSKALTVGFYILLL